MDNAFYQDIEDFFIEMNIINGCLLQFESRIKNQSEILQKNYTDNNFDVNNYYSGSTIVFRDLTEFPTNGYPQYYSSGVFSIKGETYIKFADVLEHRIAASSVALGYEALEKFLKNITARFLMEDTSIEPKYKLKDYHKKENTSSEFDLCREYIKNIYSKDCYGKNNRYLFKFIKKHSNEYSIFEKKNCRNTDLSE
ncbi:MAG TPA: hypothetical protein VFD03_01050, partial [Clostridia bacterium]|nr:hypothetical protein [Clostridia bacterium]